MSHMALTLELDGLLWTGDKRLRAGLQAKGLGRFLRWDREGMGLQTGNAPPACFVDTHKDVGSPQRGR